MAFDKQKRRLKIKKRIRKNIFGTPEMPRLSVYRSNKHISVQIIDDVNNKTLVAASSRNKELAEAKGNKSEIATSVGELIAKRALDKGVNQIVFDRNGYLYHGRVKSLAEGARKGGLKF
ncbi:50S ribosomal protein L18 [Salinivirga cyanobacteriivorans]|uniref:Large ribosomal subunit protein uL18 n=1 Tax=Salinivirga cyanobacteriivorans TaxID=1307839 RepID=A0A0S2I2W7_9BACT|nr:50S ribosomal protein L18 [Salinivirga cyanobacteriivorans]ALO16678.1 50S ribosomal protein L18 [Salinivirga cyanobacteriivorans]